MNLRGGGAPQKYPLNGKKIKAFTLAEVLITLGIIGIVAAMTMPVLIGKYQKHVAINRVKKAYSELSQAFQRAQADYGDPKDWVYEFSSNDAENNKMFIETYILPYMKGLQFCGIGDEAKEKCGNSAGVSASSYFLENGTTISFAAYSRNDVAVMTVDINGKTQPNRLGRDRFNFVFKYGQNSLRPYGYQENLSRDEIINGYVYNDLETKPTLACKHNAATNPYHSCTFLLFYDGWEMKPDYPW